MFQVIRNKQTNNKNNKNKYYNKMYKIQKKFGIKRRKYMFIDEYIWIIKKIKNYKKQIMFINN